MFLATPWQVGACVCVCWGVQLLINVPYYTLAGRCVCACVRVCVCVCVLGQLLLILLPTQCRG
jgi:hypothetical protein